MRALSSSRLGAYLGCPLQYRFRYVDHLPRPWRAAALAFGTSIHAALEWFHRARLDGGVPTASEVLAIFRADWYAQTTEPLVFRAGESTEALVEKGTAMLGAYLEATGDALPRAVEERFSVPLADPVTGEDLGIALHGVIDLVEADGTVVDVKTAARGLDAGALERHVQLSTYALAVFLRTGAIPPLRLDVLTKTRVPRLERRPMTRSPAELAWTARLYARVARAIDAGHFFPNPSWRCAECEYFAQCQRWRGE